MRWLTCLALIALCVVLGLSAWRVSKALEAAVVEAKETMHQARLALGSVRGLTFDVRRNWTANTDLQQRVTERALTALERTTRATEQAMSRAAGAMECLAGEAASTIAEARERIVPAAEEAIHEVSNAAAGVPPVLEEARATVAATRQAVDGIGAETQATIAEVRPVLQSTDAVVRSVGGIAESGRAVARYYELLATRPTWRQRAKGYIQLVLSAFNLWGNARLAF